VRYSYIGELRTPNRTIIDYELTRDTIEYYKYTYSGNIDINKFTYIYVVSVQFYADAAQCEYDVTHAICRIRKELQAADEHQTDTVVICGVLQVSNYGYSSS